MTALIVIDRDTSPVTKNFIEYYSHFVDEIHVFDLKSKDDFLLEGLPKTTVIKFNEEERTEKSLVQHLNSIWKQYREKFEVMIMLEGDEILFGKSLETYINLKKKGYTLIEPQGFQLYVDEGFDLNSLNDGEHFGRVDGNYTKPVIFYPKNLLKLKFMEGFKLIDSIKSLSGEKPLRNTETPLSFPVKLLKLTSKNSVTEEHLSRKIRIL